MISQPTTDQILLDCRRELLEVIKPAVASDAVQVSIDMLENVLRNCATRAANEIAWMTAESSTIVDYAREVVAAGHETDALTAALEAFDAGASSDLDLDSVTSAYSLAGEAFSCAIEAAIAAGDGSLSTRASELLQQRVDRELEIMGEWGFVGRG